MRNATFSRGLTNHEFAQLDRLFHKACELAKVQPTRRQASKFRMGRGRAFQERRKAQEALNSGKEAARAVITIARGLSL